MKNAFSLLPAMFLLAGCAAPRFSELPPPAPAAAYAQAQPTVRGGAPPFVYVGGNIQYPGRYVWTNGMTLKDAIAAAGGFNEFAMSRIVLEHWDGSSERYRWTLKQPLTNSPALQPGDKVYNPMP